MPDFANRLKQIRTEQKVTQKELAEYLNVSQNAIFNWENKKREPPLETIVKIADYFNITPAYIMGWEEKEKKNVLTPRDQRDIAKDVDRIMEKLSLGEDGPASYNGEILSEESMELFKEELQIALKRLKLINKERYNPHKNKKEPR